VGSLSRFEDFLRRRDSKGQASVHGSSRRWRQHGGEVIGDDLLALRWASFMCYRTYEASNCTLCGWELTTGEKKHSAQECTEQGGDVQPTGPKVFSKGGDGKANKKSSCSGGGRAA
jgi:hypothetical protein